MGDGSTQETYPYRVPVGSGQRLFGSHCTNDGIGGAHGRGRLNSRNGEGDVSSTQGVVAPGWRVRPRLASIGAGTSQKYRELKLRIQRF